MNLFSCRSTTLAICHAITTEGYDLFVNDEYLESEALIDEKDNSKRSKIISVISTFDFDPYNTASEWISLYIDDFDYPVFKKKKNSVEVKLVYTSDTNGELNDIDFTFELFVYGKTVITCKGKAPELCLSIAQAISSSYLESIRPVYTNLKGKRNKKKICFFVPELIAV